MDERAFILVAEDQADDAFLFEHTFAGLGIVDYYIACDGQEAIAYLEGVGEFADRDKYPLPNCLLMDLKMPKVNGFDVLKWLRSHDDHRFIPAVIFSGSDNPEDVCRAYELGANSYFCKRGQIQDVIRLLSLIEEYWTAAKCPKLNAQGKCVC